jgi:predicted nucleic acid-binding protein
MRVLFDTNIVLDVLLDRRPHSIAAARLMTYVDEGPLDGILGATSVTTLYYLVGKAIGRRDADENVRRLLAIFNVAPVGQGVLLDAIALGWSDFEDAVLHEAARHAEATGIVTRDQSGFRDASLHIYRPVDLVGIVETLNPTGIE